MLSCAALSCTAGAALAQGSPGGVRARPPLGLSAAALAAAQRFLCPFGGRPVPVRGARGRGRCAPAGGGIGVPAGLYAAGPAAGAASGEVPGWDAALPGARHTQMPCPPGTAPAAARFNAGVVRCMPE